MPWPEFSARLERQLKRRGWTFSDFGSKFWGDHRLPICAFNLKKAEERAMATHFSNLQNIAGRLESRQKWIFLERRASGVQDDVASDLRPKAEATEIRGAVLKIMLPKKVLDRKLLRTRRFA